MEFALKEEGKILAIENAWAAVLQTLGKGEFSYSWKNDKDLSGMRKDFEKWYAENSKNSATARLGASIDGAAKKAAYGFLNDNPEYRIKFADISLKSVPHMRPRLIISDKKHQGPAAIRILQNDGKRQLIQNRSEQILNDNEAYATDFKAKEVQEVLNIGASISGFLGKMPVIGWAVSVIDFFIGWVTNIKKESEKENKNLAISLAKGAGKAALDTFILRPIKMAVDIYYWTGLNKMFGPKEPSKKELTLGEHEKKMNDIREMIDEGRLSAAKANCEIHMKKNLDYSQKADAETMMDEIGYKKTTQVFILLRLIPSYAASQKEKANKVLRNKIEKSVAEYDSLREKHVDGRLSQEEKQRLMYIAAYLNTKKNMLTEKIYGEISEFSRIIGA